MTSTHPLRKIVGPVRQYLAEQLAAHDLVKAVDELVANNFLHELDPDAAAMVNRLHEALALYEPGEAARNEAPSILIGDSELRKRAREFETQVRYSYQRVLDA